MRHRVAGAAVAAALVVLAAGCGGGTIGESSGGGQAAAPANKNLVLMPGVKAEPFYISMQCGAQDEAARLGTRADHAGTGQFEAALQTPIVTGVLATRPAGVLIAPTDDVALANPMTQLKNAGIQVVEVDTRLQDQSVAPTVLSTNSEQGGALAAQTVARLIGERGKVMVLNTRPAPPPPTPGRPVPSRRSPSTRVSPTWARSTPTTSPLWRRRRCRRSSPVTRTWPLCSPPNPNSGEGRPRPAQRRPDRAGAPGRLRRQPQPSGRTCVRARCPR